MNRLREEFGEIDIYLFDQILRGRIEPGMRVLDAGCGGGRNLVYLRRAGYTCYGVDASETMPEWEGFRVARVENLPFEDGYFDVVISSAVLHFAADEAQFGAMLREMWRVLQPGGLLFCRLASSIGMDGLRTGWQRLPDGSERYLVDAEGLKRWTRELGGELADPLKTTVVDGQRCMTTWVLRKGILSG
jgi:SAM-dependent methyltransferase